MANGAENKYAAQLQQARREDVERQRGNEEQQRIAEAAGSPEWRPQPESRKISSIVAIFMVIVALLVDGISFLLNIFIITSLLSWIVWVYAVLGFYIWLKMLGISWSDAKGKRILMMLGAASGVEFIPFVAALPAWTAFVAGAITNDWAKSIIERLPASEAVKETLEKAV